MKSVLFQIGFVVLSMAIVPMTVWAEASPGGRALPEAQQATLSAGLAEKKSYAALIKQALAEGMDCEEVVLFLCEKCDNDPARVYEIVYAAITGGCDAGGVVSAALRDGARLENVLRAAKAAGANRESVAAAATKAGFTPAQVSSAFVGPPGGALSDGGQFGEGSVFNGPIVGGPVGGGPIGGAAVGGGAGGANASPYKR